MKTPLVDWVGKAIIVQVLADAEAYVFDFAALTPARQAELIEHHLAAFDRRMRGEGKPRWWEVVVPFALLGESMPPPIRGRFDLSAPHEGLLLFKPSKAFFLAASKSPILHVGSKDDAELAIVWPNLERLQPRASYVGEVFDPSAQSYAYEVDRSRSEGFTLGEIETLMMMSGGKLTMF